MSDNPKREPSSSPPDRRSPKQSRDISPYPYFDDRSSTVSPGSPSRAQQTQTMNNQMPYATQSPSRQDRRASPNQPGYDRRLFAAPLPPPNFTPGAQIQSNNRPGASRRHSMMQPPLAAGSQATSATTSRAPRAQSTQRQSMAPASTTQSTTMPPPPRPAPASTHQAAPPIRSPESERQFMEAYHRILQSRIDGPIADFNRDLRKRQHDRAFGPHGPNCGCGEDWASDGHDTKE